MPAVTKKMTGSTKICPSPNQPALLPRSRHEGWPSGFGREGFSRASSQAKKTMSTTAVAPAAAQAQRGSGQCRGDSLPQRAPMTRPLPNPGDRATSIRSSPNWVEPVRRRGMDGGVMEWPDFQLQQGDMLEGFSDPRKPGFQQSGRKFSRIVPKSPDRRKVFTLTGFALAKKGFYD